MALNNNKIAKEAVEIRGRVNKIVKVGNGYRRDLINCMLGIL